MGKHKHLRRLKKILLSVLSCIFALNIGQVHAATYEMNTYNYLAGVTTKAGAKLNDGTVLDASAYDEGVTVLLTTNGQYFYCLEHGKAVHDGTEYTPTDTIDLIEEAQKNKYLSAYEKQVLISRVLSLAPTKINVSYNTSGSLKSVKGNAYQWYAAQIIVWEIMVGERNADGSYRGVTISGATSVYNALNWSNSTTRSNVKRYYDSYSETLETWSQIPSFAAKSESLAKTYEMTEFDGSHYYMEMNDQNSVLSRYDFKSSGLSFSKNGNVLKVTANTSFADTKTVSGTNSLDLNKRQLLCLDSSERYQKVAIAGELEDPMPSAFFKIKIGTSALKIAKKDNKGNDIPDVQFKISYNADMSQSIGTYTTGKDGTVTIDKLKPSTVYIQEVKVPDHLILDSTVHSVELKAGQTASFTQTNDWKQGYIQVVKKDQKTGEIVKQSGTKFEVLSGNQVVATISTNNEGIAKTGLLDYGTYTIREKEAPQNYVIATLEKNQSVTENGKTYAIEIYNEPVLGKIELEKQDKETGNIAQGDATLKDAEYVLKANENILNPADGTVLYKKGEMISQKTVGNGVWGDTGTKKTDSQAKISWSNLPMGSYRIEETKPSEGYLLDGPQIVTLSSSNSNQQVVTQSVVSKEQVIKGKLEVAKFGSDGSSGIVHGLEGVEFTIKLYLDVQKNGWNQAKTYDVLVTDQTGRDTSIDLPYGIYQVKETKTPENYYSAGDFFVTIDQDKEIEYRMVNNAPFKAWLKVVKVDENGQKVSLSHATFKLKDSQGNYVKQKVGMVYKDEWTTDEKGYVVLDNMLEAGEYTIEELKTPEGFLIGDDIKVHISSDNKDITFDEDHQPVIEVSFVDEKPTGHLILHKEFEREEDTAVGGAQFKVTADSDIVDPATGKVIYKKGDPVSVGHSTDGIYMIDESGKLELKVLPLGTTGARYKVEEISTVDGYVLLEEPVIFEFDIKDNTTKEYTVEKIIENKLTETYFSKQDLNGTELKGGEYSVIDVKSGEIIDQWTSDGRTHLIKGLVMGQDYIYREDLTPLGYTYAKDVKFTMSKNKQTIVMKDTQVDVAKLDADGNAVQGATLQIVNVKTKDIVDQWITDETSHHAEGLIVGQSYILREIKTPDGFATANEMQFTVKENENMHLSMIDKKVIFSKEDAGGQEIEGALMQVIDKETEEIVDEWVSTKESHAINDLVVGKTYILHEDLAPVGKNLAQDIEFTVTDDQEDQHIAMIDTTVDIKKVDAEGNAVQGATLQIVSEKTKSIVDQWVTDETPHQAEGLIAGETYILREIKTPDGFVTANEIQFSVKTDEDMSLIMTDTQVEIEKIDDLNNPVKGAVIQVVDQDNNVVDQWETNESSHYVEGLVMGQTYTAIEIKTPSGYETAVPVTFTVDDNQDMKLTMTDHRILTDILVHKVDSKTHQNIVHNDFEFTIYSDEKCQNALKTVKADTTKGTALFEDLEYGQTVYVKETKAPQGYQLSDEVVKIVIDEQLEGIGKIYSMQYENTRIPVTVVQTGDNADIVNALILAGGSILLIAAIAYRMKRKKDE